MDRLRRDDYNDPPMSGSIGRIRRSGILMSVDRSRESGWMVVAVEVERTGRGRGEVGGVMGRKAGEGDREMNVELLRFQKTARKF